MARAITRHQSMPAELAFRQKLCRDPSTNKTAQASVTCIYEANIAGHWHNVTAVWRKNLLNYTLTISIDSVLDKKLKYTCKIDVKPWHFWARKGCKSFEVDGALVDVYWNLNSAKFASSPEPCQDYYIALVSGGEVVLLMGDYKKKAYKKVKASPSLMDAVLVYKKENVFGRKSFSTRAAFSKRKRDHEIVVDYSFLGPSDPEMWISIDGTMMIHVKNLQWKFRGNQTVVVNDERVEVFWDVHAWLFCMPGTSYGLFIFKPGKNENTVVGKGEDQDDDGCGGDTTVVEGSSWFCFFLYAWKIE